MKTRISKGFQPIKIEITIENETELELWENLISSMSLKSVKDIDTTKVSNFIKSLSVNED
jgi:hypothetical protein